MHDLYSETSRRLTETRALLEVAEILNSTLDSRTLLKRVTLKVAQVCRVDRCTLELWDGDQVVPLMSQFADGRRMPRMWEEFRDLPALAPAAIPANAQVIETRQPLVIDDCATSPLLPREWVEAYGLRSCLIVPMLRQEGVIGVMTLDYSDRPARFQDWQQDLAQAIAGQLALALENTRLYDEAQERLKQTQTLLAVGQVVSQPGTIDRLLRAAASEVAHAFEADMVGVYLVDPSKQKLVAAAGYHVPKELVEFFTQRPLELERTPALLPSWREGRAVWSSDVKADDRFDPDWVAALPPHSVMFAPTMAHGEPVGGLFLVWWRTGRRLPARRGPAGRGRRRAGRPRHGERRAGPADAEQAGGDRDAALGQPRASRPPSICRASCGTSCARSPRPSGPTPSGSGWSTRPGEWLTPLAGYHVPPAQLEALRGVRLSIADHPIYARGGRHAAAGGLARRLQRSAAAARAARGRATPQPPVGARSSPRAG